MPRVIVPAGSSDYRVSALAPANAKGETVGRSLVSTTNTPLVSQRLQMVSIELASGVTITSITFVAATTALATGVNQLFGLYDDSLGSSSGTARALLRGSVDDGAAAWAANTAKTLALTSTYTTTRSGQFYLGILINATTVPSLMCGPSIIHAVISTIAPILAGSSNTAVTALPDPANAITAGQVTPYAYLL